MLKIETIDSFISYYLKSKYESLIAVHNIKDFFWDKDKKLITEYPGSLDTKLVNNTYRAAHCLYAGSKDKLSNNIYLGNFSKNNPELWDIDEKETFDIDYEWQFNITEVLYKNRSQFLWK